MSWGSCYTPDFRAASTVGAAAGTTAANDRRLVELLSATPPTFAVDQIDTGRYALKHDIGAAAESISLAKMAATPRYSGVLFRLKVESLGVNGGGIARMIASTTTESIRVTLNSAGLIRYSFNDGTTTLSTGTTLRIGQVYCVEVFVDWNTGTTHTLKIRVDGVEILNTTGGTAIVTGGELTIGAPSSQAGTVYYTSDHASYNDVAQYGTISDWRVYGVQPISDGTHSMTANDFQDDASTNLSNATTTSWSKVSDAPAAAPSVTDFVKQVVVRSTSYMEWVLSTTGIPGSAGTPVLVCLAAAMHPVAAANANAAAFRLNSGGNVSAEAAIDTSVASNTLEYRKHHYTTEPGGAAWTLAKAQALRARFGFDGTSVTAPPALDAIMAFVLAPQTLVSATASATSATSATAAMTVTHHQYALTASATSATSATAALTVTHHQSVLAASATSATSASAAMTVTHHQTVMTATSTSATSATAHMDAGVELIASATSATSATAALTVSAASQTGGGTTAWGPHVHFPRFLQARAVSQTRANATMTVSRSRRQREDDAALLLLRSL